MTGRQTKHVPWVLVIGRALALLVLGLIAVLLFDLEHAAILHGYNGKCLLAVTGTLALLAGYILRLVLEREPRPVTVKGLRKGDRPETENDNGTTESSH